MIHKITRSCKHRCRTCSGRIVRRVSFNHCFHFCKASTHSRRVAGVNTRQKSIFSCGKVGFLFVFPDSLEASPQKKRKTRKNYRISKNFPQFQFEITLSTSSEIALISSSVFQQAQSLESMLRHPRAKTLQRFPDRVEKVAYRYYQ